MAGDDLTLVPLAANRRPTINAEVPDGSHLAFPPATLATIEDGRQARVAALAVTRRHPGKPSSVPAQKKLTVRRQC